MGPILVLLLVLLLLLGFCPHMYHSISHLHQHIRAFIVSLNNLRDGIEIGSELGLLELGVLVLLGLQPSSFAIIWKYVYSNVFRDVLGVLVSLLALLLVVLVLSLLYSTSIYSVIVVRLLVINPHTAAVYILVIYISRSSHSTSTSDIDSDTNPPLCPLHPV